MERRSNRSGQPTPVVIIEWIMAATALILIVFKTYYTRSIDLVTVILVILMALPWLATVISSIQIPGFLQVAVQQQIQSEQQDLRVQQQRQKNEIDWLSFLLRHLVSPFERDHLRRLEDNKFEAYLGTPSTIFFIQELKNLHSKGLIEDKSPPDKGLQAIEEEYQKINDEKKAGKAINVKDYLKTTKDGDEYLKRLNTLDEQYSHI